MPDEPCPELYPSFAENGIFVIKVTNRIPGSQRVPVVTLLGDSGFGNTPSELVEVEYRQRLISLFSTQLLPLENRDKGRKFCSS
jgi:hypothetical protein